jgi:hypothetical protein
MFGVEKQKNRFTVCRGYNYRVTHSICGNNLQLRTHQRGGMDSDYSRILFNMLEAQTLVQIRSNGIVSVRCKHSLLY